MSETPLESALGAARMVWADDESALEVVRYIETVAAAAESIGDEPVMADELFALATQPKAHGGPDIAEALTRAAATIRTLTVRAGKAERELCEARRELVGTRADQRTAETCARRLEAELTLAQTAASELRLQRDEAKATADNWHELLVGATRHLSDAEQERDAARAELAADHAEHAMFHERITAAETRNHQLNAELDTINAETADLREIERCKRSIEAAGCIWFDAAEAAQPYLRKALELMYAAKPDALGPLQPTTVEGWQARERWAWTGAAATATYRERIEAQGYDLQLHFGEKARSPVWVVKRLPSGEIGTEQCRAGDPGGYPTIDALEAAATWAEEHPVAKDCNDPIHSCQTCAKGNSIPPICYNDDGDSLCTHSPGRNQPNQLPCLWEANPATSSVTDTDPGKTSAGCSCGHEHDGCEGCAYSEREEHRYPCCACVCTETGPFRSNPCRYDPAPLMCEHCGKPRRDADE